MRYSSTDLWSCKVYIEPQAKQSIRSSMGAFYTPEKKRLYVAKLIGLIEKSKPKVPFSGILSAEFVFGFSFRKSEKKEALSRGWYFKTTRPDLDNLEKPTLDALTRAGVILDDSEVCEKFSRKVASKEGGYIEIVLRQIKMLD